MSTINYTLLLGYFDSKDPEVFYDSATPFGPFNVGEKILPDQDFFDERSGEWLTIDRIEHTLFERNGKITQKTHLYLK